MKGYEITDKDISVKKLLGISLPGNVIPHVWWKKILFKDEKPAYTAITLLADLVYWYKPMEEIDEQNGKFVGYRKKFKADAVQRSYDQFQELYGFTKKQLRLAAEILEELGLVKRDPRNFVVKGTALNNVMYWLIDVDAIVKFTFEEEGILPYREVCPSPQGSMGLPVGKDVYRDYTENTINPSSEGEEENFQQELEIKTPKKIEKQSNSKYTLYECLQYYNKPADERLIPDSHATTWMLHFVTGGDPEKNFSRYGKFSKELREKYKHEKTGRTADLIYNLYNKNSDWWKYETWYGKKGHIPNEGTIKKTIEYGYKWHKENTIT